MMPSSEFSYAGLWDCKFCGRKGIVYNKHHCPDCGGTIPMCTDGTPDTYPPDKALIPQYIIRDTEALRRIKEGDGVWECRYCHSVHIDEDEHCDECGASKDGVEYTPPATSAPVSSLSSTVVHSGTSSYESVHVPDWTPAPTYSRSSFDRPFGVPRLERSWPEINIFHILVGIALLVAVIYGGIWAYREHFVRITLPATIQHVSWERSQSIEVYRWVADNNQSGCPNGSRSCTSAREVVGSERYKSGSHSVDDYSYRDVPDGESCNDWDTKNNDGSYTHHHQCSPKTRQERYKSGSHMEDDYSYRDVYGTVYRYEIQKWIYNRKLTTQNDDWEPFWPTGYTLGTEFGEPERLGATTELYSLVFMTPDEKRYPWETTIQAEWFAFSNSNNRFEVVLNGNGTIVSQGMAKPE